VQTQSQADEMTAATEDSSWPEKQKGTTMRGVVSWNMGTSISLRASIVAPAKEGRKV
jgi:hypothetical protein